jgi:gliding motility-associated-like protein
LIQILLYKNIKSTTLAVFLFCGLLFFSNQLKSQAPVNDNCSGALPIVIGTPPPCGAGIQTGTTATVMGNITNATPGNPYIYQTGCSGAAPTQNFPANDVWYSFVATGYQCQINIVSTFATPNIAFYSGTCAALGGGIGGCAVGAGGVANLTVNQLVPGTTYYLQISGATGQIGTFTMNINNNINCASCVANTSITVNPLPVNGAYPPNTPVNICFHVGQYNTINTNWLHGVQLTFGPCWNAASLVTNTPVAIAGAGSWSYYPAGVGLNNGVNWGPGWYFDYFPLDGNPKNNFGDSPGGAVNISTPAQWNFCATIVTSSVCSPGCNLSVTFNTSADGESGSWNNAGCASDLPTIFPAIGSCCPPIMTSTPALCFGGSTGTAAATPVGAQGPYTYVWTGPLGYTFTANNVPGTSTITNIPAGIYTVQIIDINLCSVTNTVQVTQPTSVTLTANPSGAGCLTNGSATAIATGGVGPYTYTWAPTGGNASIAPSLPPGIYTVTVNDAHLCPRTATVSIIVTGTTSAAFTTPTYTQCLTGNSFVFSASVPGGTHTYSFNPIAGAPAVGNTPNYGPVSFAATGTYTVTHTIVLGSCTATASSIVVINPQPTVTASNNGPICLGGAVVLNANGGTTYSWSGPGGFTSAIQNPTINPVNLINAGIYTVTALLNGCSGTATTNVTISTLTTSASNTGSYCAGATIQLNTLPANTYTWAGPAGFTSNLQNPTIAGSTPAMSGTYTVTITIGICTASATTNVLVGALPTPTALSNSPVCAGQPINFTGAGGGSYNWSGPGTFTSASQNPTIAIASLTNAGTYTLTVTAANTCVNFTTTNVIVNPLPVIAVNNPFVCLNQTINLTSNGGGTYSWSGPAGFTSIVQNPVIPNANLAMSGGYTVTVTSAAGCTSNAVANVTVGSLPNPIINSNSPVCLNGTLTFTGTGGGTYSWTGPNGFVSALQNPTITNAAMATGGIYTLVVTAGTCSNSATASITINPLPVPIANSNSPVCLNNSIIFAGTGGTSYSWNGPGGYTSAVQNPTIAAASATNAGTYTLTVTDANGCVNFTTTNVVVNPLPVIVVNNPTVCMNQTINLISGGGISYSWNGPAGFTSLQQNPNIANATLLMTGQYTVTVTSAAGCVTTAISNVSVYPLPVLLVNSNSPVCAGGALNLSGSGANVYSWQGPNGFLSNIQNPVIPNVPVLASGVYTLVGTLGSCTANITASITINPLPVPAINGNSPVCEGKTISLTGSGGTTYTWTGPGGFSSASQTLTISPAALPNSGIYALTVTDINNCVNSATYNVVVNSKPVALATGTVVCEHSNAALTSGGGISYSWTGPNGFTSNNQNPVLPNIAMVNVGEYTVIVTGANSCTNVAATKIGVDPAATPTITTNSPVCLHKTLNLLASGAASYTWTGSNGFISTSQNVAITADSISAGGVYSLTAFSNKGCKGTATVNTIVNPLPTASVAAQKRGCPPLCVTFTAASSASIQSCNWNFGNGFFSVSVTAQTCYNSTGFYDVMMDLTDINGCKNSARDTVEVYPKPLADFHYGPGAPIENDQIDFNDASLGLAINSWSWYFATNDHFSTFQNPKYIFDIAGTYPVALVISNKWNCKDTIVKPVVIGEDFSIYVPNAFTPNGDGVNDTFQPKGHGIVYYDLTVFDRWGEKLFHTNDFFKGWDGIFKGELSKNDTYVWQIAVKGASGKSKSLKGIVTLIK